LVKVIVLSGVPGVGKSTIAEKLAKKLNADVVHLSKLVIDNKLYISYDKIRETYVIDEEKVSAKIKELINKCRKKYMVIEGHYGELVPKEYIDFFFVLRLNPLILYERLKERKWPERKIKENVAAEILAVPTANAISVLGGNKVCEIEVTNKGIEEVVNEILDSIREGACPSKHFIDWTLLLDYKLMDKFLRNPIS